MKVRTLIEELSVLNPDAEILVYIEEQSVIHPVTGADTSSNSDAETPPVMIFTGDPIDED